ncbi:type II toxin-antitoxin system VapC family toxin [Kamptonema animale CS-326]|jgi:PIN domain nuclease of toxin-antitoxin system|uniref:type II toxin-antitoxin system VapC family toxin n=1 Tax=Kamptonema TaxID=1501433 RepID=UPI0001DAD2B4|nr:MULTISPECIES: type II toxin-antitoxin system VapC family toxin [Kamptonema]MDB9511081.1 type II toxin-antitoxin system VapC family toxin [Kamptonema animale CS-326]CBN59398.1 PilT protein domain protein [Kamptonema sp. PCC 6506]
MESLLDTHVFLWYLLGDPNLSSKAKEAIDTKTDLYFSIASLWEISIKINVGKLQLNRSFEYLPKELQYINAQILPITSKDTEIYALLPLHHRDPFDRILIAQAMNHSLVLISRDEAFDAYPIQRVW